MTQRLFEGIKSAAAIIEMAVQEELREIVDTIKTPLTVVPSLSGEIQPSSNTVKTKTELIVKLAEEGYTVVDIAKELGLRYQHVHNTLLRKEVQPRYSRKQPDGNIALVANLLSED